MGVWGLYSYISTATPSESIPEAVEMYINETNEKRSADFYA